MFFVIISFLALCLFSFLPQRKKEYYPMKYGNLPHRQDNPLDAKTTTCLKGIFAIAVVLHHFAYHFPPVETIPFFEIVFGRVGAVAVGVFFMLSAFGITRSYLKRKDGYLKSMIRNKIPALYFVFVFINIFYLIERLAMGVNFSFVEAIVSVLGFSIPSLGRDVWFIITILALYLLFVLVLVCTRKLKNRNNVSLGIMTAISFFLIFMSFIISPTEPFIFVRAILCFPLGMAYALFYKEINQILNRFWILILSLASLVICTDCAFGYLDEQLRSILACVFVITLVYKVNIKTRASYFLGVISLEIYFIHALVQNLFARWFLAYNPSIFTIGSLLMSIVIAILIYFMIIGFKKLLKFWTVAISQHTKSIELSN